MKWKTKFAVAFAVLGFAAFGGSAWAQGQFRTVEVYMDRINISVNGQVSNLSQDSIIYDGSIYVPLRNLSEMLGAQVSWDDANRAVSLDFIDTQSDLLVSASQKGLYQYIAIENNKIVSEMTAIIQKDNIGELRGILDRYQALYDLAKNMHDDEVADTLDKMKSAIVLLQSGWKSKNMDDYYIATTIYTKNASALNTLLKSKISGTTAAATGSN